MQTSTPAVLSPKSGHVDFLITAGYRHKIHAPLREADWQHFVGEVFLGH